ncbi:MAG: GNAT family N-acetyltransferase [Opitutales bacterium]|nr:GNAT family N-acetyltransferase [Opitutales bacterium]
MTKFTEVTVNALHGRDAEPFADAVAALRITVFREFPYLYDGSPDYERGYLQRYFECPDSVVVLAREGGEVVGASTGMPLDAEEAEFRAPFENAGHDTAAIYYFGESILLPRLRGRGIGHRFFDEREARARRLGRFTHCAFCAVERPADHPRRPRGYRPHDAFWTKRGYTRQPTLRTAFTWQDLDEPEPSPKPMVFWTRKL